MMDKVTNASMAVIYTKWESIVRENKYNAWVSDELTNVILKKSEK